jgi:hypothetical protein
MALSSGLNDLIYEYRFSGPNFEILLQSPCLPFGLYSEVGDDLIGSTMFGRLIQTLIVLLQPPIQIIGRANVNERMINTSKNVYKPHRQHFNQSKLK